jgi:c-di-GMP-related signal transduction protein
MNEIWEAPVTSQVFWCPADNVGVSLHPSPREFVEESHPPKPCTRLVARQPILTRGQKIFAYELLFRDGLRDYVTHEGAAVASHSTLDITTLMGLDVLCDGRLAFINCNREDLLNEYVTQLPTSQTVVEILETVAPDDDIVAACRQLKQAGYRIALDDFGVDDPREPLIELADIIKVDLRATPPEQAAEMVKRYKRRGCRMLAEKVETYDEFAAAANAGFEYFQGYFFRKPQLLARGQMPANRLSYLRLLQAASNPEFDAREIESVVKSDASFCYRLLRYLNSARFSFLSEIHSVRHAISMLGEYEVGRWVRMVAMFGASQGRPSDLLLSGLVRARFCELMPRAKPQVKSDVFLMGLLSLMDSILEIPMEMVLGSVPIAQEIKAALLNEPSPLRPLYLLMLALESGKWHEVDELSHEFRLSESEVATRYWEAMRWARQVSGESSLH